jgi:alkanesulfonate monooxygenase SsuD/methylene tetrahydromethanopterin reductase-like flavin-dependent oxidoreductase (luciferase family)
MAEHGSGVHRIGVTLPRDLPAARILPFGRRAEELGFDELWVIEDLGFRGGIAQAAAVLATTERITVGLGIIPVGARNAAFAAMELATLAQLFPGRLIAGIGHGIPSWMRSVSAWPESPLTLISEYATAIRILLQGEPGPKAGRYVRVEGVILEEVPEIVPPIVLGVRGPKSMAVAGEVADGVLLAEPATPEYVATAIAQMGARPSDSPHAREVITYDLAIVDDDGDTARERARFGLQGIGEPDAAAHISPLAFADDLARFRASCASPEEFAATMPIEWVAALTLAGTPDEIRQRIRSRYEAGATRTALAPFGSDPLSALTQLGRVLDDR